MIRVLVKFWHALRAHVRVDLDLAIFRPFLGSFVDADLLLGDLA